MSLTTESDFVRNQFDIVKGVFISMRTYQWVKNFLVFAALFFSLSFLKTDAILNSILAFVSFCLVSSSVYLLNDIRDREADQLHPVKKSRPIASGMISPTTAYIACFLLLGAGLFLAYMVNVEFLLILVFYVLMNIGYSMGLKEIVLLDVMIVALGFLLRAVGGALAIGVDVSPWLFICTLLLALMLVFGKRRHELAILDSEAGNHRKSLSEYNLPFLDGVMFVSAGAAIVTYSLYTMADETISRFGTQWLIATTPFAIYGIFRYLYLIYIKKSGGDPTKIVITDKPFVINGVLWVLLVIGIILSSKVFH